MKMEQFFPWTIARPGVKEHASEVPFTDRTHLNNLGVGKQIVLPHGDVQVSEPMDQGGSQLRDQQVPRCLPPGKEPPTTEAKDETMEASSAYG